MTTEHVATEINAWKVAQQQFDLAADMLNLDPGLRRVLREPRREHQPRSTVAQTTATRFTLTLHHAADVATRGVSGK